MESWSHGTGTCSVVEREAVVYHIIGPHAETVEDQAGHAEVPGVEGEERGTSAAGPEVLCYNRAELSPVLPGAPRAHGLTGSSPQWQPWAAPLCQRCRCRRVYLDSNEETRSQTPSRSWLNLEGGDKSDFYTLLLPAEPELYVTAPRTPGQIRSDGHMEGTTGYRHQSKTHPEHPMPCCRRLPLASQADIPVSAVTG